MNDHDSPPAPLSLWLAKRDDADYDEHRGFLVAAEDEAAARAIIDERGGEVTWEQADAANERGDYSVSRRRATWSWDGAAVECIGTAGPTVPRGILLEDFRAG